MPNSTAQRGQKRTGQKQKRQQKKAKEHQMNPEMEKENALRYLQDAFKETLDPVLIHSVLQDYNYDVEKTLETLFVLAESSATDAVNKRVPSFKDITAGLRKIKDGEDDDSSSEEEEGEIDEADSSDFNVNNATNASDDADSSLNTWDSSLDLPLLPKSTQGNSFHPNVFKLSDLQKQETGSGVSHYNFDSYYEAEYGRKRQADTPLHELRLENGAQIDAMLAENKKWNYYCESNYSYQNHHSQTPSHHSRYGYSGNVSQEPTITQRAWDGGFVGSYPPDLTTAGGQTFRSGKKDSSHNRIVNKSNLGETGKFAELPGQTRTNESSMYRQKNANQRTMPESEHLEGKSLSVSQKQTNSHANKQWGHAERGNASSLVWPHKPSNIVPSTNQKTVKMSDRVTPLPKGKVLCLMRGLPGSGKSTLAKELLSLSRSSSGVILSTDDFFIQPDGQYQFNPRCLEVAHRQNQKNAKDAMQKGQTPVIIDNTNIQLWEMKPYVTYAQQFRYKVEFREPDTPWKFKVGELTRKNTHGVPKDKIHQMLDRFERMCSVESILKVPDKFQDVAVKDKMDVEAGEKNLVPGKSRNPAHYKPKVVAQDRVSSGGATSTPRRIEGPKSNRSGFTSGKEAALSLKTAGKMDTNKVVQETLIHAQKIPAQNAFQPTKEQGEHTTSSTDSNLSEIQNVVSSIPIASCLQENIESFQAKLKDMNDVFILDDDGSGEMNQSTNEYVKKDKQDMKMPDRVEESSANDQDGIKDDAEVAVETVNEREVEGSSSLEQITVPSSKGSEDVFVASGAEDESRSPRQSNSQHDKDNFDKYLSPSQQDDGFSEPGFELDTKSLTDSKRERVMLDPTDKGSDKVTNDSANAKFIGISGSAFYENSRGQSYEQNLKSRASAFKERRSEGFRNGDLNKSKFSSQTANKAAEFNFVPVEKENLQKQFESKRDLTQFRVKSGLKDIFKEENGCIKSSSGISLKVKEHDDGKIVNTVSRDSLDTGTNWDVTGAKPKKKRTFSDPPCLLPSDSKILSSSPVTGDKPFQSLSTVPQIRRKPRRASTPLGRRILAPSFSTTCLPSVPEPDLVKGETKSSIEEVKRDTYGELAEQDCVKRLSFEKLSENRVEKRREHMADTVFPRTHTSDSSQMGEKQQNSPEVIGGFNDSLKTSTVITSTVITATEISVGGNNVPKDTDPAVKRKTARHSKRKSPPLLDEETKLKAMTRNWSSGAITKELVTPFELASSSKTSILQDPKMEHHGSQTDASHFNLLERINMSAENETTVEGNLQIRRVRPGTFRGTGDAAADLSDTKSSDIPHRRKIDKSSMTEEPKTHYHDSGLDLLSSIFPHIGKDHIREVLQKCKGNAQWASEILVESNHVATQRRKRKNRQDKTLTRNDQSQLGCSPPKTSRGSQTSKADFLFLKVTMDNTKVSEKAPNVKILPAGRWKEVCGTGIRRNEAAENRVCHVGTYVDLEELIPNFDEDLSKLLQSYLDVPFLEVCEMLERNKGNVPITEMELQRKFPEEIEESPHSAAGRDVANHEHESETATQDIDLSTGTGASKDKKDMPEMQHSSSTVIKDEHQLQKGNKNKGKPKLIGPSMAANELLGGDQASLSDQESSYTKRGREMSERDQKPNRSQRGRSRSLPRKKPDSLTDKKLTTVTGSKKQKSSEGNKRGSSPAPGESKSVQYKDHPKGAAKVKHPGTEEMYKRLPDKPSIQNLKKRTETPEIGSSSGPDPAVQGAVGYDHRLSPEGISKDKERQGMGGVNENQGKQGRSEVNENEQKAEEPTAGSTPSDLLNEVGKGVPARFHQGMMFQLDMAFALQLQEIFGSVGYCIDTDVLSEDDLAIPVDLQLAKAIHSAWCKSFKQKFDREEAQLLEMMKQDEALAKKLQEEEEKMKMKEEQKRQEEQYLSKDKGKKQTGTHHSMHGSPVAGNQSLGGKTNKGASGSPVSGYQSPAGNLRDIMDDHVAEEIGKDMQREDALSTEKANSLAVKLRRKQLIEKYPGIDPPVLEDIFMKNNFDIDPTVKEIEAMKTTSQGVRNVYSAEALQRMEEEQLQKALEESVESQYQQVTSRRSPKTQRRVQPDDDEPDLKKNNKFQSLEHPDYHDYRAEANLHYKQRQECFRKASEAFRKGQREQAAYYSEEGHKHTALLQEANQRASEAILADKNKEQDDDTLDLHGLHVDEALEALETKMVEKSTRITYSNPFLRPSPYLHIITGRGNHSKYGVAKIKPAVINFLRTKGYGFDVMNQGMIKVKL